MIQDSRPAAGSLLDPLSTRRVRVVCKNDTLRIEWNTVSNASTQEQSSLLRIAPANETQYAAIVVPILEDGRLLLLGRYRYAARRWSIEFPRIFCTSDDDGWKDQLSAGLLAETGLRADRMSMLGSVHAEPSLLALETPVVLAEDCEVTRAPVPNPGQLVAGAITVFPDELDYLVRQGEIICAVTLSALYLCQRPISETKAPPHSANHMES